MAPGSHLGVAAFIFMRLLGDTEWFFGTGARERNETFAGAAQ